MEFNLERANVFGDVRAEQDHEMLDHSFHEWQDYRTLFESNDRFIVVGRRGTGKSALTYRLEKDWRARKFSTIVVAPTEEQVIGLRPVASLFGTSVSHIRAGIKLAWRYALLLEIASLISNNYKAKEAIANLPFLSAHLKAWRLKGDGPFEKLRIILRERLRNIVAPEDRIADLPSLLELTQLQEEVASAIISHGKKIVILIDRLDEGYEPDIVGIGIVDGLIYGTDEIRNSFKQSLQAVVFLRDNLFRAIQIEDRDFSRNLEGQVLRLHWDPEELLYMVTKRIRKAFGIEKESDIRVWNAITSDELHGREAFKHCLKQTLYRPRDVIALLNTALSQAKHQKREILIEADFVASARQISTTRFDDLGKEYESVFPGVKQITSAFANGLTRLTVEQASLVIQLVIDNPEIEQKALQHLKIIGGKEDIIKALGGFKFEVQLL